MISKSDLLEKIECLLASAKGRDTLQGILIYEAAIKELHNADEPEIVLAVLVKLNHALAGMEAHGYFTESEFTIVKELRRATS